MFANKYYNSFLDTPAKIPDKDQLVGKMTAHAYGQRLLSTTMIRIKWN